LFTDLAQQKVVLLGEMHDNAEHHRWQLQTLIGLYAWHQNMAIGLEMLPHRAQGVLDEWAAGKLSEEEFLKRTQWRSVWGFDPQLYMPILNFARMNRIPVIALNVDRSLTRKVSGQGWASVPAEEREGIGDPFPASAAYLDELYQTYRQHQSDPASADISREDVKFRRFVESMLLWDRSFAQGIAERLKRDDKLIVVGIMGAGHLQGGVGVRRQLDGLGVQRVKVLLPWDSDESCAGLTAELADALFGIASPGEQQDKQPRLGVALEDNDGKVRVGKVVEGSIAQHAGLRQDDIIETMAGERVADAGDVIAMIGRTAPGTWLPITVRRGSEQVEVIARFPPRTVK
jgi:uncharacterized iron-regulated protein